MSDQEFMEESASSHQSVRENLFKVVGGVTVLIGLLLPFVLSPYYLRTATFLLMWVGLASSWNIVGGYIEYPSFGHVAFFGLGAIFAGVLTNRYGFGTSVGIEFISLLVGIGLLAGITSLVLGPILLRLRSHYFAIAMLGVAEAFSAIAKYVPFFSGVEGFTMPLFDLQLVSTTQFYYYLMGGLALGTVILSYGITRMKLGYGFAAIREDEDASRMIGVPTTRYKLYAFVLSAIPPAVIGAVWAYFISYVNANSAFATSTTINMIVMTLIGGISTVGGPVAGAGVLYVMQTYVWSNFLQYHQAITGAIIIAFVLLFPEGIVGAFSKNAPGRGYINRLLSVGGESDEPSHDG